LAAILLPSGSLLAALVLAQDAGAQGDAIEGARMPTTWPIEAYMVLMFGGLGLLVMLMQFWLFLKTLGKVTPTDIMRVFSTTLILISIVTLIGVGYSSSQVQPAMSLIGTLLGYLMGRGTLTGESGRTEHPKGAAVTSPEE
jgi:hypothetical protein